MLVGAACAQTPPERDALPSVEDALDPPAQCSFLLGEPQGVLVQEVTPESAADGLLIAGDVIVAFDDEPTPDSTSLLAALDGKEAGEVVELDVMRGDEETQQTITLGEDGGEPRIGVSIRTQYQTVEASDIDTEIEPGPTVRPISIGGTIYLFDPASKTWERTDTEVDDEVNWVSAGSGIYAIEEGSITDIGSGEVIPYDGFEDWEPIRIIGSAGDDLILVVTQEVPEDPERVAVGVSRFNPGSARTVWAEPVVDGFGIPISALGSPDGSQLVVVGVDEGGTEIVGIDVWSGDGVARGMEGLVDLGTPVGWTDDETVLFRTESETGSLVTVPGGDTEEITLESAVAGLPLFPVGDGRNVLAIDEQTLVVDDLTLTGDFEVLAENCSVTRVGEPGWAG
jgi:PDZ domain